MNEQHNQTHLQLNLWVSLFTLSTARALRQQEQKPNTVILIILFIWQHYIDRAKT